jgi:hypothetical protein
MRVSKLAIPNKFTGVEILFNSSIYRFHIILGIFLLSITIDIYFELKILLIHFQTTVFPFLEIDKSAEFI